MRHFASGFQISADSKGMVNLRNFGSHPGPDKVCSLMGHRCVLLHSLQPAPSQSSFFPTPGFLSQSHSFHLESQSPLLRLLTSDPISLSIQSWSPSPGSSSNFSFPPFLPVFPMAPSLNLPPWAPQLISVSTFSWVLVPVSAYTVLVLPLHPGSSSNLSPLSPTSSLPHWFSVPVYLPRECFPPALHPILVSSFHLLAGSQSFRFPPCLLVPVSLSR